MADVVEFKPNKRSVRRLALMEVKRLNELYHLSAGGQDPLPVEMDPEIEEMVRLGVIETPWREF